MPSFRELLRSGRPVVGDGAWGTQLMHRGLSAGSPPEAWTLEHPEVLEEIATAYVQAGAQLLTTNTFGASPLRLESAGLAGRCDELNRRAVEICRQAAGDLALVSGSVGPCGRLLEPYGDASADEVRRSFTRQIAALLEAGADLLCIETMIDLDEARLAIDAARSLSRDVPVVATMTFDVTPRGHFTAMGVSVQQAAEGLAEAGADLVGSNCGHGIATMVEIARDLADHATRPLAIQSNAGLPRLDGAEVLYPETPDVWAERASELADLGVALIGGCCGTGPAHISRLCRLLRPENAG